MQRRDAAQLGLPRLRFFDRNEIDIGHAVRVSAATGEGIDSLLEAIDDALKPLAGKILLKIPHGDGNALALCYERGRVVSRSDEPEHVVLEVEMAPHLLGPVAGYRV